MRGEALRHMTPFLVPAFVQAAFRAGDPATQIITTINPYMIVLLPRSRRRRRVARTPSYDGHRPVGAPS